MKAKYSSDQEYAADQMRYLCGCELTAVVFDSESGMGYIGLCFESDSEHDRQWTVWVQSDAEGNDGGFLNIVAENEAAQEVVAEIEADRKAAIEAA